MTICPKCRDAVQPGQLTVTGVAGRPMHVSCPLPEEIERARRLGRRGGHAAGYWAGLRAARASMEQRYV